MNIDIQKLKAAALSATCEQWEFDQAFTPIKMVNGEAVGDDPLPYGDVNTSAMYQTPDGEEVLVIASEVGEANGKFIAAANPAAILSLIAAVESAAAPQPAQSALSDDDILQMFANAVGNEREDAKYVEVCPDEAIAFARNLESTIRAASHQPTAAPVQAAVVPDGEWQRAQAICDMPAVDEAIRGFTEDSTGDNATMIVREVMRALTAPAAPSPAHAMPEYTVSHSELARKILTFFGCATSDSLEPNADPFADRLAEKLCAWIGDIQPTAQAAPASQVTEVDFLEEWLTLASTPVGLECCGQSSGECCGNGIAVERSAEEVIAEMAARHRELTDALAHKPASGEA